MRTRLSCVNRNTYRAFCLVASLVVSACSHDSRARVFPRSSALTIDRARWSSATVVVMYWPDLSECRAFDSATLRSLAHVSEERSDIQLLLVLPAGADDLSAKLHIDWPGKVVWLDRRLYKRQTGLSPLPRLEVWDTSGKLLLLQTIPPNISEAENLGDRVRWLMARAVRKAPEQ